MKLARILGNFNVIATQLYNSWLVHDVNITEEKTSILLTTISSRRTYRYLKDSDVNA